MKRTNKILILIAALLLMVLTSANAQSRRPIDNQHPLWLVHVDVWNQADPQKIIDLIPDDIKPYVCMNLSLSCAYDTELNIHQRPQNAIPTYKSWASVCQMNNMWFTCQPASGGHTHIHDNDLETFEYFFKAYPNFLGWNFAEQFWGFNAAGDKFSSSDVDRIALFAKLVPMHHKYGGFLTVSFCGNIWSHTLNPVGMMKRNADLLQACKDYPDAILWLYKYTTSSCFYNNESVSFGPFAAGLARNYGVRYDNCGYNGALDDLFPHDSDGNIQSAYKSQRDAMKYPVAAGIGTVMEQTCQNGGAVWDGPELIWTEDFKNEANQNATIDGATYSQRRWSTYPGFRNIWMDMWRKIIDGTMYIPSQQEVIDKTKIIVVNEVKSGSDEDMYAAWGDLYDGLYKQTDPLNKGNGQWMNNYWYLKSTGRYGAIPVTPTMTEMSKNIPVKVKKSTRTSTWSSVNAKVNAFNAQYPVVSTGDLFVSRYRNQLVTYTPYSYMNAKKSAKANVPLKYNTCESLDLTWNEFSNAIVKEYADHIDFYLNNFRADTVTKKKDVIVVNGVTKQPSMSYKKREQCLLNTPTEVYDQAAKTYTVTVEHDGPIDITINCEGDATGRATDIVPNQALETPQQPEKFFGKLIIEAEDMDTRSVKSVEQTPYYSSYKWVRGQAGNGFVCMGTNTQASLHRTFKVNKGGEYRISVRYNNNTAKSDLFYIRANKTAAKSFKAEKTAKNEWVKGTVTATLNEGTNDIYLFNTKGIDMMIDQVILTPADIEEEKYDIVIQEGEDGGAIASTTSAAEGTVVTLTPNPKQGFALVGWNIIHGNIDLQEQADGSYTFTMPEDIVTLQPVFKDQTLVYEMNLNDALLGTFPTGWRANSGSIQEYPNSYGSGPRIMGTFTGTYTKGLYWRVNSADYGQQSQYPLTLKPGKYVLTYAMAAWNGTPQYKAQILTSGGNVVNETTFFTASPNAAGKTSSNLSSAVERQMEFTITKEGNFTINFQNNGTGFSEFLLLACRINTVIDPTDVQSVFFDGAEADKVEVFTADGIRIPRLQKGINLLRINGQVKTVYVR